MSGLELNINKTVCIPLWEKGAEELKQTLSRPNEDWKDICISEHGTYLGFCVGPGRCGRAWDKPIAKYLKRCYSWGSQGLGLQLSILAYNTFAASTLSFIAQLECPTEQVLAAEAKGLRIMLPGPGNWFVPEDAFFLKEAYGQAKSFHSINVVAQAAKIRVFHNHGCHREWENEHHHNNRILSLRAMSLKLSNMIKAPIEQPWRQWRWKQWYDSSFPIALVRNVEHLRTLNIRLEDVLSDIANAPRPWDYKIKAKQKQLLQKTVAARIKRSIAPDAVQRIRHKIDRSVDPENNKPRAVSDTYKLGGPKQWIAARVTRNLQRLPDLVAPRVCGAVLRLLFNGWCTPRRFQKRESAENVCVLGCSTAEDSIEHYGCCPAIQETLKHKLKVAVPNRRALSFWMLNEMSRDDDELLICSALIVFAAYMATNHYRHTQRTSHGIAKDALRQFLIQGVQGHSASTSFLDNRWARTIRYLI
jgi:hypothetical protein